MAQGQESLSGAVSDRKLCKPMKRRTDKLDFPLCETQIQHWRTARAPIYACDSNELALALPWFSVPRPTEESNRPKH